MKKILFLLAMLPMLVFTACSDDDEAVFNYPMETLYGTWEGIAIDLKEGKIDLTNWYYSKYRFSATLNPNGTYSGSGYFGNGKGTYKATGNTIYTYVGGEEYLRYEIVSIFGDVVTIIMMMDGCNETLRVKVKKE